MSDLGFKSRSTFSKTFKRLTGLTPSEFQRIAYEASEEQKNS
ncbi:MAG: helix-turn-helix domain-containing protein [Duncaniella sp.]|nr:helix-turn-helix domain-containing protein [Duncaniella sp.]